MKVKHARTGAAVAAPSSRAVCSATVTDVEPKPSHSGILLAPPPSGSSAAVRFPPAREPPRIDERLVEAETRQEMVRGRRVMAMPANPAHGDRHFELDYVIRAHVRDGYVGSTDLLTRSTESSDFATDTCVRKKGEDPRTGARYLEELAFEVVNEQTARDMTERAEDLTTRGVRRIVAIFVKKGEVSEWSAQAGEWKKLDVESTLADPTLARPLRIKELLDAAEADNAVVRALVAKNNPVIAEIKTESRREGHREGQREGHREGLAEGAKDGLRQGIEAACELLAIELRAERRAELSALDAAGLAALLARIRTERRWP